MKNIFFDDKTVPPFDAYAGDDPFIFVSYSHDEKHLVYPELKRLYDLNYRIWYDEGIDPGNEWPEEIANALSRCGFYVVFISPRSVQSKNVRKEINYAINKNKPIIAIHLEETQLPPGLELQVTNIQAISRSFIGDHESATEWRWESPGSIEGTNLCTKRYNIESASYH